MMIKLKKIKIDRSWLLFFVAGVASNLTEYIAIILLTSVFGIWYILSNSIAMMFALPRTPRIGQKELIIS